MTDKAFSPANHIRERIRFFSSSLDKATREAENATPHSNRQKKAKADIAKCKKKIIKLQKELKAVS